MSQSLEQLLSSGSRITPRQVALMQQPAVEAIVAARVQGWTGELTPKVIIFNDSRSIAIDTSGPNCADLDDRDDVRAYGKALNLLLEAAPTAPRKLKDIAARCANGGYENVGEVHLALEKRVSNTIYIPLIIFIIAAIALLWLLNSML